MRGIASELSAKIGSEKSSAFTNYIIQNEEAIREWQELNFYFAQRINLVIRSDELDESRLSQRVRRI